MTEMDANRDKLLEEESARLKVELEKEERVRISQAKQAEEDASTALKLQQEETEEIQRLQRKQEALDMEAAQKAQAAAEAEAVAAEKTRNHAEEERLKRQQEYDAKHQERLLHEKQCGVDAAGKILLSESLANYNNARVDGRKGVGGRVKTQAMTQKQHNLENEHQRLKNQAQTTDVAVARQMEMELAEAQKAKLRQAQEVDDTTAFLQKQQEEEVLAERQGLARRKQEQEKVDATAARLHEEEVSNQPAAPAPAHAPAATEAAIEWACSGCTFINQPKSRVCEMCDAPNPSPPPEEDAAAARLFEQELRREEEEQRRQQQERAQTAAAADEEFARRLFAEEQQRAGVGSKSIGSGSSSTTTTTSTSTTTPSAANSSTANTPTNTTTTTTATNGSATNSSAGQSYDELNSTGRWCTHCQAAIAGGSAFFTIPQGDFHKECHEPYQMGKAQRCVHCTDPIYPVAGKWSGKYFDLDEGAVHSECQEAYDWQQQPTHEHTHDTHASEAAGYPSSDTYSYSQQHARAAGNGGGGTASAAADARAAEAKAAEARALQKEHVRAEGQRVLLMQQREAHRLKQQEADEKYARELLAFEEAHEREKEREQEWEVAEKTRQTEKEVERTAKQERNAGRARRREAAAQEQQEYEVEEAARKEAHDARQMKRQLQDTEQRQQEMQLPHQMQQEGDGGAKAKPCAHCGEPLQTKGQSDAKVAVFAGGLMVHMACADAFHATQAQQVADQDAAAAAVSSGVNSEPCPICMERPPRIEFLPCQHRVCTDCASLWQGVSKKNQGHAQTSTCPFCRGPVHRFQDVGAGQADQGVGAPVPNRCGWCKELVMSIPGKFSGGFYTAASEAAKGGETEEEEQIHFECYEAFIKHRAQEHGHKCAHCNYAIANITIQIDAVGGEKATTRTFSGRSTTIHDERDANTEASGVKVHSECYEQYQHRTLPRCDFCKEMVRKVEGKFSGRYRGVDEEKGGSSSAGDGVGGAEGGAGVTNTVITGPMVGAVTAGHGGEVVAPAMEQLQVVPAQAEHSLVNAVRPPPTRIVHEECYEGFLCAGARPCEHCQQPVCSVEGKFSGKFFNTLAGTRLGLAQFEDFMRAPGGTWEHSAQQTKEGEVHSECWDAYKKAIKEREDIAHIPINAK
jgi:hypothetical protein